MDSESGRGRTRSVEPTLDQARAFCAVAEALSYREAAKNLGKGDHVKLVRLISRFTKTLGYGRLIEPEAKGRIRLTARGRSVLPAAKAFVEAALELTELRPEIRFSAYPTIAARMAQECPQLLEQKVPLVLKNVSEANRQDGGWKLVHDIVAGRLDMAIAPAGLEEDSLTERPLYSWRLRVIFPGGAEDEETKKLRQRTYVTPAQIARFRIAVAPAGHKSRELLREAFDIANVTLKIALESPNQDLLRAVALGGTQHAAVIPDDAFFEVPNVKTAPYLLVKGSKKRFGGDYALYMRKNEGLRGELASNHEAAIANAAELLIEALGDKAQG